MSVSLLLGVVIVIILLGVANTSSARAGNIKPEHFFDFEYAKSLWLTKKTTDEFYPIYDCNEQDGGVFNEWEKAYRRTPQQALDALATHAGAEAIKRCYDVRLAYEAWGEVYDVWRGPLSVYGSKGWNQNTRTIGCLAIRTLNIFTGQCNDLPDWRTPKNAAEDAKWMARGNARWKKLKK